MICIFPSNQKSLNSSPPIFSLLLWELSLQIAWRYCLYYCEKMPIIWILTFWIIFANLFIQISMQIILETGKLFLPMQEERRWWLLICKCISFLLFFVGSLPNLIPGLLEPYFAQQFLSCYQFDWSYHVAILLQYLPYHCKDGLFDCSFLRFISKWLLFLPLFFITVIFLLHRLALINLLIFILDLYWSISCLIF